MGLSQEVKVRKNGSRFERDPRLLFEQPDDLHLFIPVLMAVPDLTR